MDESDRDAIRSVIQQQLEAFQNNDAVAAFALAAPEIQSKFETPENFLSMVRQFYQAVYRPRSVLFEDLTDLEASPAQPVLLLDQGGQVVKVVYVMQKQPDGCWRIAGCL
ncbi:MAG: DUF4864 domain-containing protein [Gemmatimonadaceae bacterium]|nr:DUF4864 domain-containing protein [Gloeobacterales cyanobacterium ES-bin-141]